MALEQDEKRRLILRVKDARQPPPDWGVLIGECAYQYRSALDHLALQLAIANRRSRLPARITKRSEFPIFTSGPDFKRRTRKGVPTTNSGWAKIEGTSREARAVIERLQPYHRRKNPRSRFLWQLRELSNIDKHRLLHVTYSSLAGSQFTIELKGGVAEFAGYEIFPGPLKPSAVLAIWDVVPEGPDRPMKTHVEVELVTDITFGQGSPARPIRGESVVSTLYGIGAFIASDVLPPLTAELGLKSTFKPGRLIDAGTGETLSV